MSYLILSAIVIAISYFYEQIKKTYNVSKGVKFLFYFLICFTLCLFAGLRTKYNDTGSYINHFLSTPTKFLLIFDSEFSFSSVYLFKIWNYIIYNFVSQNANVYLFLCSLVFVCPAISLIEKYSKKFTFSILMFMFAGMFLFSLAGLKQAMAIGVFLKGLPYLFKKKYIKYYIFCFIAMGFHMYSFFFLIVPILGNEVFNIKTFIFCMIIICVGVFLSYFASVINALIEFFGKDISEDKIQDGSVNVFRVLVYLVPLVLTLLGKNKLSQVSDDEKWFIKLGVFSTMFMVLALFGNPILFGRIPLFFVIGTVVTMPLLLEKVFVKGDYSLAMFIASLCYVLYGIYALYVDGAFDHDIFQLIWF